MGIREICFFFYGKGTPGSFKGLVLGMRKRVKRDGNAGSLKPRLTQVVQVTPKARGTLSFLREGSKSQPRNRTLSFHQKVETGSGGNKPSTPNHHKELQGMVAKHQRVVPFGSGVSKARCQLVKIKVSLGTLEQQHRTPHHADTSES